jgi:hypothetical protein
MSDVIAQSPAPASLFGEDSTPADKPKKERKNSAAKEAALAEHLPPNLGKPLKVTTPDFSDPNRPKTCLEVDFPLVPINALSALEGNAGKPIYQMSKWWARRRSCVFRALLLAAAIEAPTQKDSNGNPLIGPDGKPLIDEDATAQAVWDAYYANHQLAGNFKNLKVLEPFMGGGTTLVEGSRLGFHVAGVDLNPVAWFVVKNELASTDPKEVKTFFDQIEAEVKPQVQPFYVTECPRGHKGKWFDTRTGARAEVDPAILPPDERSNYRYEGPEVIYTFWAKHGPCVSLGCDHRTPVFRSPVIAEKKLGAKYFALTCKSCKTAFHAELGSARMAPAAERVILPGETPFTELSQPFALRLMNYGSGNKADKMGRVHELLDMLDSEPGLKCPHCGVFAGEFVRDVLKMHRSATRSADIDKKHLKIEPARNSTKPIYSYLLIHPNWLKGISGRSGDQLLGGYIDAPVEATALWNEKRLANLKLIEVRGRIKLSDDTTAPDTAATDLAPDAGEDTAASDEPEVAMTASEERKVYGLPRRITLADGTIVDTRAGNLLRQATLACQGCGQATGILDALRVAKHSAPTSPYALQCFCPECKADGYVYDGRYFAAPSEHDVKRLVGAIREWDSLKTTTLDGFWPTAEIPYGWQTHYWSIPDHGYTHWYRMFNPRQLLVHAHLLRAATRDGAANRDVQEQTLGAIQQYLRNQCMFAFWDISRDCMAPFFSSNNYVAKQNVVENCVFATLGRGNWYSCVEGVNEGIEWARKPWEPLLTDGATTASSKVFTGDAVNGDLTSIACHSSTSLPEIETASIDLVITDPPFGDNFIYSELANFFYAWLRLPLTRWYPDIFRGTASPFAQEAVKNVAHHDADADDFYKSMLIGVWSECFRVMRDGATLAFTFHHSEDSQWVLVLESLFESGLVLTGTYPITSDESKGENAEFGSKRIEYDILHVCRKRLEEPKPVSWPKMRQWVKGELSRLRPLLESFKNRGLSDADIRVILRGKALEFYSRHYGKVLVSVPGGEDAVLSIRDALLGINQLLDESSGAPGERPPGIVQPVVYQYLRLFGHKATYSRDEVSKLLRGTAIQQRDFERTGSTPWIEEHERVITRVPIYDRFQKMVKRSRRELKTELDQSHFLIGAAMPAQEGDTSVNIEKELERETFLIRPGVEALLDWYSKTPAGADEPGIPKAAATSLQLLRAAFEAKRARMKLEDPSLFDEWEASLATVA